MSNPWFRLYSEIIEDEKLLMLAFEDRWHYVAILCLKNKGLIDSELDQDKLNRKLAIKLGVSLSNLEEIKRRLIDERLIDSEWRPINWDDRQFKSDSSKDRVKRYREKQRLSALKRNGNVTVTIQDTDTDTDTDKKRGAEKKFKPIFDNPVGIKKFTDYCKSFDQKPIPEKDPIFKYMEDSKIPDDALLICWLEFVQRHTESNKRYQDWRSAFRKCVRGNWYKLWWVDDDGVVALTSLGKQAKNVHAEKLAA